MSSFPIKPPTNSNYNQNIMGFVPSLIIQHLLEKETRKFPEKQTFKTVVMFADISGFTNLSETLQKRGNEGSELLAFVLNRYMELLIKSIGRSGGDIFKFAGDAMIVLWPPPESEGPQLDVDLLTLCRQAVQSGLDIKNKLDGAVMFEKKIRLSVKIGFGIGDVTIMHVGGVFQRAEYLPAGDPLTQAFECEHHATGGGQVIVSTQVWEMVNGYFNGEMIQNHGQETSKNAPFYLVYNLKAGQSAVQMKADALLIRTRIGQGAIQAILPWLESYIPKALLPYIKIDQEKWSAELRRLSVMFLNLGIDLTLAKTEEGLTRIQTIIKTVQSCLYQSEGSLNKLLMDDKGSTLIVVFGLPPMAHQDDSVRGILAAFKLRHELSKINCACSIGLTTGLVFTGVVGTSGNRREYSVLGDTVNLSARLMQAACGEKENKVLVDEETKNDAEHKIKFKFFECRTVKGKTGQIPIYAPINCLEEIEKVPDNSFILRTHLDNIPDDMFMIEQYKDALFMLRREKETELIMNVIKDFIKTETRKIVLIKGEYGIGKSLFMRCVLEGLKSILINEKRLWKDGSIFIFVNGFNSLSQKKKLNGWRKFLRFSIEKLRMRLNLKNHLEVFKNLKIEAWKNKIIENVLELDKEEILKKEIIIEKEKITKEEISLLHDFALILIKKLIEGDYSPLILCLDDMQNFDEESWVFLLGIMNHFEKKILFFCIVRDKHLESGINLIVFNKNLKKLQKFMKHEDIADNSTQILLKEIKGVDTLSLAKKILGVNDIADNLIYFFHHKTKGNPLKLIHLIQNLLQSQLVQKNIEKIEISEELTNLFYINEFITLPIPLSSIKINSSILDKLSCKQILLMKLACIIGDSFNLTVLKKLNPFKDQGIPNDEVENILKELEDLELIGIIDETESNITYQFSDLFMREVLYQRMTYNQRRELHRLFAESMQNFNTNLFLNSKSKAYEKIQCEKLMFHWRLAETQSVEIPKNPLEKTSNFMTGFSNIAKRSVIVKKISSLASTKFLNPLNTLKKGLLQYKAVKDLFWSKKFCILNFKEIKLYASEDDFNERPDKFIGSITLKQIFSIAFMSQKNRHVFLLRTGSFQTPDKDIGLVHLYFSHEDFDILEEWATYIEFARAKAIYDDFVNTFGKISFPLQSEQRIIKKERAIRKHIKKKIDSSQSSVSLKDNRLISDSIKDFGAANISYLQTKHLKLKENLTLLINNSLLNFLSTLVEKASSEQNKEKSLCLGKNTLYMKLFPQYFNIKSNFFEEESQTFNDKQFNEVFINRPDSTDARKKSVSIDLTQNQNLNQIRKSSKFKQEFQGYLKNPSETDDFYNKSGKSSKQHLENYEKGNKSSNNTSENDDSLNKTRKSSNGEEFINTIRRSYAEYNENISDEEEKVNIPAESLNAHPVRSRLKSSDSSNLQNSSISSKMFKTTSPKDRVNNNGNKVFTFNSTNSLEIISDKKQSGCSSELYKITSGPYLPTPKLNNKYLSQIQEEDIENEQRIFTRNSHKGEYKLKGHNNKRYKYISHPEINDNLPIVFYSRRNSLKRNFHKTPIFDQKKKKIIKYRKSNTYKTLIYIENENERKKGLIASNEKNRRDLTPSVISMSLVGSIEKEKSRTLTPNKNIISSFMTEKKKNKGIHEDDNKISLVSLSEMKKPIFQPMPKEEDINEMEDSFEIVKIKNNGQFSYGFTLHKSQSLEGDYVEIPKNELVVIMNIFKTLNKIECLWKGFIGIFSSDDIKIVYMQNCHK